MKRISSSWTPVCSVLGALLPLGFVPMAFVFAAKGEWLPVGFALAATIAVGCWWFFVLRRAAIVFADEQGLVIKSSAGDVTVRFGEITSIRRVTGARGPMYRVRYRAEGGNERNFILIPAGPMFSLEFPHPVVKSILAKMEAERRREVEIQLNRSYLAPFG